MKFGDEDGGGILMDGLGVPQIVPGLSDRDRAASIRQLIEAALVMLCRHMDAARGDGFEVNFQIGEQAGKRVVTMLTVAKHF